jgi:hypothetical protein
MNWSMWVRQSHRWLSITFTVAVIANLVVMGRGDITLWVGLLTLLPLVLLLLSGLYLIFLPHARKWRGGWRARKEA